MWRVHCTGACRLLWRVTSRDSKAPCTKSTRVSKWSLLLSSSELTRAPPSRRQARRVPHSEAPGTTSGCHAALCGIVVQDASFASSKHAHLNCRWIGLAQARECVHMHFMRSGRVDVPRTFALLPRILARLLCFSYVMLLQWHHVSCCSRVVDSVGSPWSCAVL